MLDPQASLAVAFIAVYTPLLLVSAPLAVRHVVRGRDRSFILTTVLCILRLISGSVELYMHTTGRYTAGLVETATITSSIGTAPLLLVQLGFSRRANRSIGPNGRAAGPQTFRVVALLSIASLALGIAGGVESGEGNGALGRGLREASALAFLAVSVVQAAIAGWLFLQLRQGALAGRDETRLTRAAVAVVPFLLVRLAYSVASAFATKGSTFYFLDVNVYAEAFMMFLMEVIVVAVYLWAGFVVQPQVPYEPAQAELDSVTPVYPKPSSGSSRT